jgi:hypothetical protein
LLNSMIASSLERINGWLGEIHVMRWLDLIYYMYFYRFYSLNAFD